MSQTTFKHYEDSLSYSSTYQHIDINTVPIYVFKLFPFLASQEDDSSLLRFLECKFGKGPDNGPEFFYDPKYALRLCLKEKRMRACVHIYSMMSMHEEAVALALQVRLTVIMFLLKPALTQK